VPWVHEVDLPHLVSNREVNEKTRKPRVWKNSNNRDINDRMFGPGEATAKLAENTLCALNKAKSTFCNSLLGI
jgi:hypothetical protein